MDRKAIILATRLREASDIMGGKQKAIRLVTTPALYPPFKIYFYCIKDAEESPREDRHTDASKITVSVSPYLHRIIGHATCVYMRSVKKQTSGVVTYCKLQNPVFYPRSYDPRELGINISYGYKYIDEMEDWE